jgi:hypothetical protein
VRSAKTQIFVACVAAIDGLYFGFNSPDFISKVSSHQSHKLLQLSFHLAIFDSYCKYPRRPLDLLISLWGLSSFFLLSRPYRPITTSSVCISTVCVFLTPIKNREKLGRASWSAFEGDRLAGVLDVLVNLVPQLSYRVGSTSQGRRVIQCGDAR